MKCRDFKKEFEDRASLNKAATQHLDSCTDCQKFSFEQTRLREMLGGLTNVEAPKDFDFQLKAKIARAKPENYRQTELFPALRYILPLSAVLIVLSVAAMSGLYFVDLNSVSPVAVAETPNAAANTVLSANSFSGKDKVAAEKNPLINDAPIFNSTDTPVKVLPKNPEVAQINEKGGSKDLPAKKPKTLSPIEKDKGGGSGDFSVKPPEVILIPRGINPDQKPEITTIPNVSTTSNLNELLEITGIKTESSKVVSVGKNSLAEAAGVKIGDVIEEINGKAVIKNSIKVKTSDIKTLTVLRKGERKEIVLQIN